MSGRIYSIQAENSVEFVEKIDQLALSVDTNQIFVSRLPQSRLLDVLDISSIRCYWLTSSQGIGTIEPSLEKINHFLESTLGNGEGIIFLEGLEWLTSLHGFESVHSMIRTISERISMSEWTVYIAISPSSFSQRELSRIHREAPVLSVTIDEQKFTEIDSMLNQQEHTTNTHSSLEMDLNEDGTPKLVMLTKLPKSGFTKQILQRRILQWRRMGLDTTEIESSLYREDLDSMYTEYIQTEEKVRRAVELERYILAEVKDAQERTVALFRIRQLTGLDELENRYFLN